MMANHGFVSFQGKIERKMKELNIISPNDIKMEDEAWFDGMIIGFRRAIQEETLARSGKEQSLEAWKKQISKSKYSAILSLYTT